MKKKRPDVSGLKRHARVKNKLVAPWNQMPGNVQFSSWVEERLPDLLWLAIVRSTFEQKEALDLFRKFILGFNCSESLEPIPTHSFLCNLGEKEFDRFMHPLLASEKAKRNLGALLLFDELPDRSHWSRHAKLPDDALNILSVAVLDCLNHQSQESTDIRWLSIMCMARNGKIQLPNEDRFREMAREWDEYPDYGDQRKVRPSIRATEMAFRTGREEPPSPWCSSFWQECWQKTKCVEGERSIQERKRKAETLDVRPLVTRIEKIYGEVAAHFHSSTNNTKLDAKHDASFGFIFYGLYLAHESLVTGAVERAIGQVIVRVLAESVLTFAYLAKKDDLALWAKYRNYGLGQLKLSFLKLIDKEDVPEFVDLELFEKLIGEDFWHEHLDIDLGHWAGSDLRKMSEEIGKKDIYDKYYSTTSPFVHGTWSAVRTVAFETCLNPLHRFHRIPTAPNLLFNPSFSDLRKLLNLALDLLASLYPEFKARIRDEDMPKVGKEKSDA